MASRSETWNHFEMIFIDGVLQKGKCNYCKSDIMANTIVNGTSALRKHFNICKRNPHRNIGDDKQAVQQVNQGDSVNTWKFDPDGIRVAFTEMIIEDELPFAFGDKSGFKKFMSKACPRFSVPSRRTCTRDIVRKSKTCISGGKYLHMRCAAHIVNLIVSDDLKEVDTSVKRVRAAVRYVRNSPNRITKFKECVDLEKVETKAFLNLDVSTRWNSIYYMLKAAASYEKVFARYATEDPYFALDLLCDKSKDKGPGVPEEQDWDNVNKLVDFLAHFADLTTRVSASLHVTANSFFHEIGEVNILVKKWMDNGDGLKIAMAERMKDKYDKYWGNWHEPDPSKKGKEKENMNLLIFIAAALDPRYKLAEYTNVWRGQRT